MTTATAPTVPTSFASPHEKLQHVRNRLKASLVDRDDEIDLVLTSLIAGKHCLLIGPPGVAKSMLLTNVADVLSGHTFQYLMTKTTTPEEIFGPWSIQGLKEDRFQRVTAGRLPHADFAFLDEIFKANSAVLNNLLRVLNEGRFDDGTGDKPVPLQLCMGASNEVPADDNRAELAALFDRFLVRKWVKPVRSSVDRKRLLFSKETFSPDWQKVELITPDELAALRAQAKAVQPKDDFINAYEACLSELAKQGVHPGDRRQRLSIDVARAGALVTEEAVPTVLEPAHGSILEHVLWDDPAQADTVASVVAKSFDPLSENLGKLTAEWNEIKAKVDPYSMPTMMPALQRMKEIIKKAQAMTGDRAKKAVAKFQAELDALKAKALEL